jgi:2-oxoisovalerate dehydrogenase E2 component (dihydrolipoyl transacylase)
MGTYVIKMPDIGEGIAEVELVLWHVKVGDVVAEEQTLADVMTDKANVEIPSHVAGKVISLTGKPGDVIAVGTEIIRLEVEAKGNVSDESSRPLQRSVEPGSSKAPKPAEMITLSVSHGRY